MSWYFLHKTINLKTGEYFIGIHQSFDTFFGRMGEGSWDPHLGTGARLQVAIEKYGKKNFIVQSIFCHADKSQVEKKFKDLNIDYHDPLCLNGMNATISTPERNRKVSEGLTGYKQTEEHISKKNLTHRKMMWIKDGVNEKYVQKGSEIPEGWIRGRLWMPRKPKKQIT